MTNFGRECTTDLRPRTALQAVSELQTGNRLNGNHNGRTFICCTAIIGLETADGQNGRGRGSPGPSALPTLSVPVPACQGTNVREQAPRRPLQGFLSEIPRLGMAVDAARARVTLYG